MKHELEIPNTKAVILAAGVGSRVDPSREGDPKCLLHVGGIPILERTIRNCLACGVADFVFVLGFHDERVSDFIRKTFPALNAEFVHYTSRMRTSTGHSLALAEPYCRGCDFIKLDADIVFEAAIISGLLSVKQQNCLCIDRKIQRSQEEIKVVVGAGNRIFKANKSVLPETAIGEFIGIEKIGKAAARILFAELSSMVSGISRHQEINESVYEKLIAKGVEFHTVDITGLKWLNVASREDTDVADDLFGQKDQMLPLEMAN